MTADEITRRLIAGLRCHVDGRYDAAEHHLRCALAAMTARDDDGADIVRGVLTDTEIAGLSDGDLASSLRAKYATDGATVWRVS